MNIEEAKQVDCNQEKNIPMTKRAKKDMHIMLSRNIQQAEIRFKELEHLIVKYTKENKKALEGHLRRAIGQRNEFQSFLCANGVLVGHPMNLTKIERDKYWISDCDNGLDRWVSRPAEEVDENIATYAKEPNENEKRGYVEVKEHTIADSVKNAINDEKRNYAVNREPNPETAIIYYEKDQTSGWWPITAGGSYITSHTLVSHYAATDATELATGTIKGENMVVQKRKIKGAWRDVNTDTINELKPAPFKHSVEDSENDERFFPIATQSGRTIYFERSDSSGFWPMRAYYNKEGYMHEHYIEDIDQAKKCAACDALEIAYATVEAEGRDFTVVLASSPSIGWRLTWKSTSENPHAKLREPLGTTEDLLNEPIIEKDNEKEEIVHWIDEVRPPADTEFETVITNTIRTENGALFNMEMDNKGKGLQLSNKANKPWEANLIYLTHKDLKQVIKVLNDIEDYMAVCADGRQTRDKHVRESQQSILKQLQDDQMRKSGTMYTVDDADIRGAEKKALDEYYDSLRNEGNYTGEDEYFDSITTHDINAVSLAVKVNGYYDTLPKGHIRKVKKAGKKRNERSVT